MAQDYDVAGKVVLITGAARGIGAGIARRLAGKGAQVALVGIEPELLAQLADELGGAWFEADVRDAAAVQNAVDRAVERFGGIDVVIANAGIGEGGSVAGMDLAVGRNVIDVNFLGTWYTLRAAVPHVAARRGYVLALASMAGVAHPPFLGLYSASKAGVIALTDSLRVELKGTGAKVGAAMPSFVDTDMVRNQLAQLPDDQARSMPGMSRPMPLEKLVDLLEEGITHRAKRIVAPKYLTPTVLFPRLVLGLMELLPTKQIDRALRLEREAAVQAAADTAAGAAAALAPESQAATRG